MLGIIYYMSYKSLRLLNHSNFPQKLLMRYVFWEICSNDRAPALHAGSTGIDSRILQSFLLAVLFSSLFAHLVYHDILHH